MPSEACAQPLPATMRPVAEGVECHRTKGHRGPHESSPDPMSKAQIIWFNDGLDVRPDHPDTVCLHTVTQCWAQVTFLSDSGQAQADIRINCAECDEAFLFPEGIVVGLSLSGVARSMDAKELRIAITPESQRAAERVFGA